MFMIYVCIFITEITTVPLSHGRLTITDVEKCLGSEDMRQHCRLLLFPLTPVSKICYSGAGEFSVSRGTSL